MPIEVTSSYHDATLLKMDLNEEAKTWSLIFSQYNMFSGESSYVQLTFEGIKNWEEMKKAVDTMEKLFLEPEDKGIWGLRIDGVYKSKEKESTDNDIHVVMENDVINVPVHCTRIFDEEVEFEEPEE